MRTLSESGPVGDLAPAGSAVQPERNHLGDTLDNLAKRAGAVDVFKDAASPLFKVGQGRGFLPNAPLQRPASNANGNDHQKQQADDQHEVTHIQPRRPRDDGDVVNVAHQDVEGHLAVERIRVSEHADARDANVCAYGNLAHGAQGEGTCCARMADDGGEQVAVGIEHIFVLRGLANLGNYLAFN